MDKNCAIGEGCSYIIAQQQRFNAKILIFDYLSGSGCADKSCRWLIIKLA
jgi:hypothetical protein